MSSRPSGRALLVAAVLLSTLTGLGTPPAAQASPRGVFTVVGHRGYPGGRYDENSIAAFDAARRAGATAIETDLHLSADLVPVVMHDQTLGRTTTCSGMVEAYAAGWIEDHCLGRLGRRPVPTAAQVLRWGARRHMNEILEIKQGQADLWTVEQLTRFDELVRRHRMRSRVLVMSFTAAVLRRLEGVDPAIRTQWIAPGWRSALTVGAAFDGVNLYARQLTGARVRRLHAAGRLVLGRRTNQPADWRRLRRVGADGLLTDHAAGYLAWRRRS